MRIVEPQLGERAASAPCRCGKRFHPHAPLVGVLMSGQTGPDQHQTRHQRRVRQREVDCELPTVRARHQCARPSLERLVADRPQLLDSVDRAGCGGRPAAARTVVAKNRRDLLELRHVVLEHAAVEAAGMQQDDRAPFAPHRPMERHGGSLATAQLRRCSLPSRWSSDASSIPLCSNRPSARFKSAAARSRSPRAYQQ
jgi:hypothetical protein